MDTEQFWQVIDPCRLKSGPNLEARITALHDALSDLPPNELESFQAHYDEQIRRSHRWDLWGAAEIMHREWGCSDDGFRYFRDWLISEGRKIFENALANPDSLADLDPGELPELEPFGYVATKLYRDKTSGELNRDFSTELEPPAGEQWDEDDLGRLFPRLTAKYSR
jgi:Protein of unknown function (DUF4240)